MPDSLNDDLLMGFLVNGDESALESIYDRYNSLLYSVALRIVGDSASAEEVVQDAFLQLWRKASQFDSARGSLIAWLLTITRHRAISRVRQRKSDLSHSEDLRNDGLLLRRDAGPTALEQQIARQLLTSALAGLPKAQQETITLAYFDGLTCEEIAAQSSVPLGTVKSRLRSGISSMKKSLAGHGSSVAAAECARTSATLDDILITSQLSSRPCRQRDPHRESAALLALGKAVAASPGQLIDSFLQLSLDLCSAGTSGLSVLEEQPEGGHVFRWTNLAGKLSKHVGGTTPRNFSPCGVTLDCDSAQLFYQPGRYFKYFNSVDVPIVEGLVIPIHVGPKAKGTIWIVSHTEGHGFDSEDARIMTSLCEFVGCALNLIGVLDPNRAPEPNQLSL